jgi:glyoxylase-like metal-dependent hydrolase (beta-lactamase superfamily II)
VDRVTDAGAAGSDTSKTPAVVPPDVPVEPTPGVADVYTVDTELLGSPGVMSAYLVDAERPALVDTGADPATDRVLSALAEVGIAPEELAYVLPTHVHLDHGGAAGSLAAECPNATVLVHERGYPYLTDPERIERLAESARRALGPVADAYGDPTAVPERRCRVVGDGEAVDLGDHTLRAVDAPGHAPHHLCYLDDRTGALFAADAAGMYLGGRLYPTTPPPDFDLEESLATVERLRGCGPETVLYGHFGARDDGTPADRALADYADLLPEWVSVVEDHREGRSDPGAVAADLPERWGSPTVERDVAGILRFLDA